VKCEPSADQGPPQLKTLTQQTEMINNRNRIPQLVALRRFTMAKGSPQGQNKHEVETRDTLQKDREQHKTFRRSAAQQKRPNLRLNLRISKTISQSRFIDKGGTDNDGI
jgi:hypothetical protein